MRRRLIAASRTIRVRIIAIVALCWLLPTLVLGVYMSSVFFDALREKTEQALVSGASHAQQLTTQELDRILKKSKDVTYDEQLADLAANYEAGTLLFDEFYSLSRAYWMRMFQREEIMNVTAFFLVERPMDLINTVEDVRTLLQFREKVLPVVAEIGETLDTQSRFASIDGGLYHVRNLYTRRLERFGMLALGIRADELFAPLLGEDTLWRGQADIILDEYEYTADAGAPSIRDDARRGLYEDNDDMYYAVTVATSDYTFSYRIQMDGAIVSGQEREYTRLVVALILFLLPLEALILLFIHYSMTRPLLRLSQATEQLASGGLGVTIPTRGENEIAQLGGAFNTMSLRIQDLIDKSYREELALRDARISALQSRVNPHFLNNALELMNWQARLDGADTVSEMVEALSTLLNAALDRIDERTVPLQAEVEVADAYFYFIRQRFGGRVSIEKNIDPSLSALPVPRLIIQTLLENAVEHGISPAGGGIIRLDVYIKENTLFIDVRNNGKCIEPDEQEKINQLLRETNREVQSQHLGIRNVNLRLKLIYHDQAGLTLGVDENGETLARISIPVAREDGQA